MTGRQRAEAARAALASPEDVARADGYMEAVEDAAAELEARADELSRGDPDTGMVPLCSDDKANELRRMAERLREGR